MAGMIYTVKMVTDNVKEYMQYPAFISQKSEKKGYVFPKIRICSNSMHSRKKMDHYFPGMNLSTIQTLYGIGKQSTCNSWNENCL